VTFARTYGDPLLGDPLDATPRRNRAFDEAMERLITIRQRDRAGQGAAATWTVPPFAFGNPTWLVDGTLPTAIPATPGVGFPTNFEAEARPPIGTAEWNRLAEERFEAEQVEDMLYEEDQDEG
jgi:hypothetical protein